MPKGNPKSNYPNAKLSEMDGQEVIGAYVSSIIELSNKGRPTTEDELEQRINDYFNYCADRCLRPGIEGLSLALGTNRMTFWHWCGNSDKYTYSERWIELCRKAKQAICAFLEMTALNGRLNPATYIFLAKNWLAYDDKVTLESVGYIQQEKQERDFNNIDRYRLLPMFENDKEEQED